MTLEQILLAILVLASFAYSARQSAANRRKIKERANREAVADHRPDAEELESRLGELELMYEDLEESYWVHVAALVALCAYLYWHIWYVSIIVGFAVAFLGCKFVALRPFTTGIADIR